MKQWCIGSGFSEKGVGQKEKKLICRPSTECNRLEWTSRYHQRGTRSCIMGRHTIHILKDIDSSVYMHKVYNNNTVNEVADLLREIENIVV